ncbi:MAG: hypothetical protein IPJ23_18350 [Ignavibacteriales bacterium]|nr:hypothetical protein [Ignavibacteriales bacterium]
MKEYASQIATERFNAGFGLHEVHTAFNALEEEIWTRVTKILNRKTRRSAGSGKYSSWSGQRRACFNLCNACK